MGAHKTLWRSSKVDEIINLFGEAEIGASQPALKWTQGTSLINVCLCVWRRISWICIILESVIPKIDFKLSHAFFVSHFEHLILPSSIVFRILLWTSC